MLGDTLLPESSLFVGADEQAPRPVDKTASDKDRTSNGVFVVFIYPIEYARGVPEVNSFLFRDLAGSAKTPIHELVANCTKLV